jgi:hypothetical protein
MDDGIHQDSALDPADRGFPEIGGRDFSRRTRAASGGVVPEYS